MNAALLVLVMLAPLAVAVAAFSVGSGPRGPRRPRAASTPLRGPGFEAVLEESPGSLHFSVKPDRPPAGRVLVCQAGVPAHPDADPFGTIEVRTGDREFDLHYVVRSTPPALARDLLDAAARERFRAFGRRGDVSLVAGSRVMALRFVGLAGDDAEREKWRNEFRDLGLALAARLCAGDGGVLVLDDSPGGDPTCQVCGTPIGAAPAVCTSCATPHHRDCWEFMGRCSTYACGSVTARR